MAIFQNQSLRTTFITNIDDGLTSQVLLKYRKPDGTEGTIDSLTVITAEDGVYAYDWSVDELDTIGTWTFWSFVTLTTGEQFPGNPWQSQVVLEGNYPVNKETIKSILGITDSTQDADIDSFIPIGVQDYLRIRNAPFDEIKSDSETVGYIYPEGIERIIAKMYEFDSDTSDKKDLTSENIGSYSWSKRDDNSIASFGYPYNITSKIKKFVRGV